jgi:hypothetical protein
MIRRLNDEVPVVPSVDYRIVALALQLCYFVEHIAATEDGASCRISLDEAHRARVVANNLRPLLHRE